MKQRSFCLTQTLACYPVPEFANTTVKAQVRVDELCGLDLVTLRPPPGLPPPGFPCLSLESPAERHATHATPAEGKTNIELPHPGNIGHPYACIKPCVYLLKGGSCAAGSGCDYCHLPHDMGPIKPNKMQRQRLRQMTDGERLSVCLPQIWRQALHRNLLPQATSVLRLLEAEFRKMGSPSSPQDIPGLDKVLARMSFVQLVLLSMNNVPPDELRDALAQLRLKLPPSL